MKLSSRKLPSRIFFALALLLTLLATDAIPAAAQFSGPALSTASSLNQPVTLTVDQSLLNPGPRNTVLVQGDVITIRVFGTLDYNPTVTIGTDGQVMLPLIGLLNLNHLTITAAEELIANRLSEAGMYRNPQVMISVSAGPSSTVTVIGELHGVIPVEGARRLLDILAAAGGLPPTASHVLTINRPGVAQPIVVDLGTNPATSAAADIPVFPGDTIVVSRVGVVYLLGEFKTSGAIPLGGNTPLTLLEATSLGGGTAYQAKLSDLRLIRTIGDKRILVHVDMKRVMRGQDPDPILQANDILYLPDSFIKTLISNGSVGTIFGLVSLALTSYAYLR